MKRPSMSTKTRFAILKRDNFTCQYCGARAPEVQLQVDHVVPVSESGPSDDDNLITSCITCNHGKGASPLERAYARPLDTDPAGVRMGYFVAYLRRRVAVGFEQSHAEFMAYMLLDDSDGRPHFSLKWLIEGVETSTGGRWDTTSWWLGSMAGVLMSYRLRKEGGEWAARVPDAIIDPANQAKPRTCNPEAN